MLDKQTADGRPVRIIDTNRNHPFAPIVGYIGDDPEIRTWRENGDVYPLSSFNDCLVDNTLTIELTKAEVAVLNVILQRIGGNPDNTPRKHTDSILSKIGADARYTTFESENLLSPSEARIHFAANSDVLFAKL